ncbi:MAG: hypothetical protein LW629_06080 [Burkholderiales bacterium]|nr:hypothetical protein [Burkholderiales bacterium]
MKATGTDETYAVMNAMKKAKINDFFAKNGVIREDGRMVHAMYLIPVKKTGRVQVPVGLLQCSSGHSR